MKLISTQIRVAFQIFTLGIFIYQSKQSIEKYFEYPVIIQKSGFCTIFKTFSYWQLSISIYISKY